jgi:hypothetical protein
MFNIFKKCNKSSEIEELQSKLAESDAKFTKLNNELEQGYIKDRLIVGGYKYADYIDKLGKETVNLYTYQYNGNYCLERKLTGTWSKGNVILLRDFLVKNFPLPVEHKDTLEGAEALEFLKSQSTIDSLKLQNDRLMDALFPEKEDVAQEPPTHKQNFNDVAAIDNNAKSKHKAFSNANTDYYELTRDVGRLEKGTIFYHDIDDSVRGSIGSGCLKLCWTSKGNCQAMLCGDTVVFHIAFKNDVNSLFRLCCHEGVRI